MKSKQALLDQAVAIMKELKMPMLDPHRVAQCAFIINCGYKPDLALTPFTAERIFWLMDERSQWLLPTPPPSRDK